MGHVVDDYVATELQDGCDAVEWLAAQPFCDGNVAMMGISYSAFTALQVAALRPPHLRTVIPIHSPTTATATTATTSAGTCGCTTTSATTARNMGAFNALPPDPASAEDWAAVWEEHLKSNQPYLLQWLRRQTDD